MLQEKIEENCCRAPIAPLSSAPRPRFLVSACVRSPLQNPRAGKPRPRLRGRDGSEKRASERGGEIHRSQMTPSNDPVKRPHEDPQTCGGVSERLRGGEISHFREIRGGEPARPEKGDFCPHQIRGRESDAPSEILRSAGADPVRLRPDGARLTASRRGSRLRRQGFGRGAPPSPAYHNPP